MNLTGERSPFDPYIVFDSVNELLFPKWKRTLALVLPWIALLLLPVLRWIRRTYHKGRYVLFFIALFCCAIPLKMAWVTFATLLLLGYAGFDYLKKRNIEFDPVHGAMLFFFLVPLLLSGNGEISQVAIPAGFAMFAIIGSLTDFSDRTDDIKKIYITVFLVITSITAVSWLLLMAYYGYYAKNRFARLSYQHQDQRARYDVLVVLSAYHVSLVFHPDRGNILF